MAHRVAATPRASSDGRGDGDPVGRSAGSDDELVTRFTVEILPEAEAEFREAFLWYFERSPVFADALRAEVLAKIDDLREDADTWPKDEDGISFRILAKRFKYTIHYDLVGDLVTVLAIAPQLRQPGYWKGRSPHAGGSSDA